MKCFLVPIFAVFSSSLIFAQNSSSETQRTNLVSVEDIVQQALAKNPELNFYRKEIEAAKGEKKAAGEWQNPQVSSSFGGKRITGGTFTGDGNAWAVSAKQTIEWPGRISLRKAIANKQLALSEFGFERFKAALAARTRILAFNLFAAQERENAVREVSERFHALRDVMVQRDPTGLTPTLELRIIEATALTIDRKVRESESAVKEAAIELNQLRGAPLEEVQNIASPVISFGAIPDNQTLLQMAETNNFEIKIRGAELEQQGFKLALAKNERYPSVAIGPYFAQESAGDREQQVGVELSFALPLWSRNTGKITAEAARKEQATTSFEVTRLNVQRQVLERAAAYRNMEREMKQWRADSIKEFQSSAALADRHYRLGAVPIATYVELQKQYLEGIETLLVTKKDALEAALQIEQLVGVSTLTFITTETEKGTLP